MFSCFDGRTQHPAVECSEHDEAVIGRLHENEASMDAEARGVSCQTSEKLHAKRV